MIELKKISAGYGHPVIHNISTHIEKGKVTCIIGPNGSGKTTLLRSVLHMVKPVQGEILIEGQNLTQLTPGQVAQKIAYLAQGHGIPEMTVEQLVLQGRFPYLSYPRRYSKQDYRIAMQAIQQMGIEHLAEKRMKELSGGMRQSAYIAMALAQNTDYILMDEPTTYLDIANQMQLMQILKQLASQGKGILLVLHDLIMALEMADRILVMQDGKVQMDADIDAIYTSGILEQVYQIRVQRTQDGHYYYC